MMRVAVARPMPGTVISSFSVAVLMSIRSGVFSFARFFTSSGLLAAANELDVRVSESNARHQATPATADLSHSMVVWSCPHPSDLPPLRFILQLCELFAFVGRD